MICVKYTNVTTTLNIIFVTHGHRKLSQVGAKTCFGIFSLKSPIPCNIWRSFHLMQHAVQGLRKISVNFTYCAFFLLREQIRVFVFDSWVKGGASASSNVWLGLVYIYVINQIQIFTSNLKTEGKTHFLPFNKFHKQH